MVVQFLFPGLFYEAYTAISPDNSDNHLSKHQMMLKDFTIAILLN